MPFLFAATLFVSASLLFMIQPMVGKMVLPLLGGSPAVWNACMVFFQALLLLGYLYSHQVSAKYPPRKQWIVHNLVLGLPIAAFILAIMLGTRHSPIAIAESLAPGGNNSNPVLSVLLLLTVAIGIPFFVVSTSAPLLQKWFTCTGHPSARDPYFLYSASNFGSMISLLGYPLFIEPYLSITGQAWLFAAGFAALAVLVVLCGYAAAHPIGTPPSTTQLPAGKQKSNPQGGQQSNANHPNNPAPVAGGDAPTIFRKLKWITLAFVPSSLMLGVTFYMTTDIASIPLLWVLPLALYLVTFIIAFARLPEWFRLVIGNLAPVMILLLVFVMLSGVISSLFGVMILIHLATFFAAALMCHYELARDRPSPQYLTEFFLLMSAGGVLGGIFNSLLAPLIFPHSYEYRIVLIVACLMVPRLTESGEPKTKEKSPKLHDPRKDSANEMKQPGSNQEESLYQSLKPRIPLILDFAIPIVGGVIFYYFWQHLPTYEFVARAITWTSDQLKITPQMIVVILVFAAPIMICFFFVDRPLRFALCVAAILGPRTYREEGRDSIHSERSFFGILKIEKTEEYQRPNFVLESQFTDDSREIMLKSGVPDTVIAKLQPLKDTKYTREIFGVEMARLLSAEELEHWRQPILDSVKIAEPIRVYSAEIEYLRLVHGTTLHGMQISKMQNNVFDSFQFLTACNPWDNIVTAGANHAYLPRQEPLTYYHRSGPVGAMFHELRTRKGGSDGKSHFAMVGLGTGSASAYAQLGQKITFYEIDPAVKHLTYDSGKYFTYVTGAKERGADVDIRMGDARLQLQEATDQKYSLLLVDAFSSDSIPVHLLTKEAVQLYLDRMTDDGILALHISNKFVRLEPVVAAIARDLGLTARVWNDDVEKGQIGKTMSSWVALARTPEQLGSLFSPIGDLMFDLNTPPDKDVRLNFSMDKPLEWGLISDYPELSEESPLETFKEFKQNPKTIKKYEELNQSEKPKVAWLQWVKNKKHQVTDPREKARLELYETLFEQLSGFKITNDTLVALSGKKLPEPVLVKLSFLRNNMFHHEEEFVTELNKFLTPEEMKQFKGDIMKQSEQFSGVISFHEAMVTLHGHGFRKLEVYSQVHAWTDDYSDVMRVMMLPELQRIRKFFGLPTPIER